MNDFKHYTVMLNEAVDALDKELNKVIEEKYNNLLEYGFSIEIIKKIQDGNDTPILLDDYENIMYDEYIKLMN